MRPDQFKQIFKGKLIHYTGSITGVPEKDKMLPLQIIKYLSENGAKVLNPHIAIQNQDELYSIIAKRFNLTLSEYKSLPIQAQTKEIYQHDIGTLDKATHVIALVNGPSFGVGMELQRALDKPKIGKNYTCILGLVHENFINQLSPMIRGATEIFPNFSLKTYISLEEVQIAIYDFLTD